MFSDDEKQNFSAWVNSVLGLESEFADLSNNNPEETKKARNIIMRSIQAGKMAWIEKDKASYNYLIHSSEFSKSRLSRIPMGHIIGIANLAEIKIVDIHKYTLMGLLFAARDKLK